MTDTAESAGTTGTAETAGEHDRGAGRAGSDDELCELCAEPLANEHRHLADLTERKLLCACRACSILFDHGAAGGKHYRLVPDRRRYVPDFELDDAGWESLGVPVTLAFFFRSGADGGVVGFYPSPAGPVEADLDPAAWHEVERRNPVLTEIEPDVEALLVYRTGGSRDHWLVPIDRCYALVALVRLHWEGFTGGDAVWTEIARFVGDLSRGAHAVGRDGTALGRLSRTSWAEGGSGE